MILNAANLHDSMVLEGLVDSIEPIKRPRERPENLQAGKACEDRKCRSAVRRHGIKCRIVRKGMESRVRLGRHRWVVERTLSWLAKCRRLTIRYDRRSDIHLAFLELAAAPSSASTTSNDGFERHSYVSKPCYTTPTCLSEPITISTPASEIASALAAGRKRGMRASKENRSKNRLA